MFVVFGNGPFTDRARSCTMFVIPHRFDPLRQDNHDDSAVDDWFEYTQFTHEIAGEAR